MKTTHMTVLAMLATFLLGLAVPMTSYVFPARATSPVEDKVVTLIHKRCEAEWPDDFRMQLHCRKRQEEGRYKCGAWLHKHKISKEVCAVKDPVVWCRIFTKCSGEWWDENLGHDWRMVAHCLKRQEESYEELTR